MPRSQRYRPTAVGILPWEPDLPITTQLSEHYPAAKTIAAQCTAYGIKRLASRLASDNNFASDRATQLLLLRLTL